MHLHIKHLFFSALLVAHMATPVWGHFQTLIPSTDIVDNATGNTLRFDIIFTHPMEWGPIMHMEPPQQFQLHVNGKTTNLLGLLSPQNNLGKTSFTANYRIKQPGDHIFSLTPHPYWEPAEEKMIIHYTKVVVDGYGAEDGWDASAGLPVEIEPLVRPYGLWTGNQFRGIVKKNGQPVPFAVIEVEYYNRKKAVKIPADSYVTQVIKADGQGVFSYVMPKAGWWSFAALLDGDKKMANPQGKPVDVELGGLIWVRTRDMKSNE